MALPKQAKPNKDANMPEENAPFATRLGIFRREVTKKTQVELAKELNMSRSGYAALETGTNLASYQIILYLHNTYNLNYEWYFQNKGNMVKKETKSLVLDVSSINSELQYLQQKVNSLEANMRKIYKDFYSKKD